MERWVVCMCDVALFLVLHGVSCARRPPCMDARLIKSRLCVKGAL